MCIGQMSGAETVGRIVQAKNNGGNIFQDMSPFPNRPGMRAKHDAAMGRPAAPSPASPTSVIGGVSGAVANDRAASSTLKKRKRPSSIVGSNDGDLATGETLLGA